MRENEAIKVLTHISRAMRSARILGVFHRDIKPPNILIFVEPDGSTLYKLADFGICKSYDPLLLNTP